MDHVMAAILVVGAIGLAADTAVARVAARLLAGIRLHRGAGGRRRTPAHACATADCSRLDLVHRLGTGGARNGFAGAAPVRRAYLRAAQSSIANGVILGPCRAVFKRVLIGFVIAPRWALPIGLAVGTIPALDRIIPSGP